MIYGMFSIYDSKAEAFLPPFILPKTTMAQRAFGDCVNSPTHQFSTNPEDFTLMKLGNFDDENGRFEALSTPRSLGLALEYIKHDNDPDISPGNHNGKEKAGQPQDTHIRSNGESPDSSE